MFISLDLETTGVDKDKDKIIEFGAVKFDFNGYYEEKSILIQPGISLPQIVTHITGITDEHLKDAPSFEDKREEIAQFIGELPIIGHNIQFDTGFLRTHGIPLDNPEYDTCQLATIFLPGLPSYSLEIISQTLNLTHEDKHRALDDALAAKELFLRLTAEFQQLETPLIEKIKSLCLRTDWPARELLISLVPTTPNPYKPSIKTAPTQPPTTEQQTLLIPSTSLHQLPPPYDELALTLTMNAHPDSYIAVPHKLFRQIEASLPDNFAKIDAPRHYLSKKRLQLFSEKEHFSNEEFTSLLKLLIWENKTTTGLLSELKFLGKEKSAIHQVNITENPQDEPFYKKAMEKDQQAAALVTHEWLGENKSRLKDLILIDFSSFTENIFYKSSSSLTLQNCLNALTELPQNPTVETLNQKITILFGIIGLLNEKYNDHNSFGPRTYVDNVLQTTKEFLDIKKSIANLYEISQDLAPLNTPEHSESLQYWKKCLETLKTIFIDSDTEKHLCYVELNYNQEPSLHFAPYSIVEPINEVLQNSDNYRILDQNIDLNDNGNFLKELYQLPKDLPVELHNPPTSYQLFIAQDAPSDDQKTELVHYFEKNIQGNCAIVFNSQRALQYYTLELSALFKETNSPYVLASQLTGSLGKITEQFKKDPSKTVLLLNRYFWESLPTVIHQEIQHLYIHRIPFDPPSHPFILTQSRNYRNAFFQFQIPRAAFALRSILNCLTPQAQSATLLDSRLATKDYGTEIIESLNLPAQSINIF